MSDFGVASSENTSRDWIIWQLVDSSLPTGAFVSSSGLEISFHLGLVTPNDRSSLRNFISNSLKSASAGPLVFVNRIYSLFAAIGSNFDAILQNLSDLDYEYDTHVKSNHVAYRISQQQGMAFLTVFERSFQPYANQAYVQILLAYKKMIREGRVAGHLPIVFSVICFSLEITRVQVSRLYIFILAKGIISAAVRLNIVGPFEAQTLLASCSTETTVNETLTSFNQISPLLDTVNGMHDLLYSRLFNS